MKKLAILAIILGVLIYMGRKAQTVVSGIYDSIVNRFALAIQKAEGWYPGSWSYRTNNPGNITDTGRPGQIGTKTNPESGITFPVFDSYESGFAALTWKINRVFTGVSSSYSPAMTIYQFFDKWSKDPNEARNVAATLGVSPDTKLSDLV